MSIQCGNEAWSVPVEKTLFHQEQRYISITRNPWTDTDEKVFYGKTEKELIQKIEKQFKEWKTEE